MLILERKVGEAFLIGDNILIKVIRLNSKAVGIGIAAPRNVSVARIEDGVPVRSKKSYSLQTIK